MLRHTFVRASLAIVAAGMITACAESTAPVAGTLVTEPNATMDGGANLNNMKSFAGQVYVCPQTSAPGTGFAYKWSVTNNATSQVVGSGVVRNVTANTCVMLSSVPTDVRARYTVVVREDPGGSFTVQAISASYGNNFPGTAPTATRVNTRTISSMISHDFGVQYTFHH
ncbi:MAG: hypothetical protein ABIZ91_07305 [Gemmatimonadaceae bacterium]